MLCGKARSESPTFGEADCSIEIAAAFIIREGGVDDFVGVVVAQENFGNSEKADDDDKGNQFLGEGVNAFFATANEGGVNVAKAVDDIANAVIHVFRGKARIIDGGKDVADDADADRNQQRTAEKTLVEILPVLEKFDEEERIQENMLRGDGGIFNKESCCGEQDRSHDQRYESALGVR